MTLKLESLTHMDATNTAKSYPPSVSFIWPWEGADNKNAKLQFNTHDGWTPSSASQSSRVSLPGQQPDTTWKPKTTTCQFHGHVTRHHFDALVFNLWVLPGHRAFPITAQHIDFNMHKKCITLYHHPCCLLSWNTVTQNSCGLVFNVATMASNPNILL